MSDLFSLLASTETSLDADIRAVSVLLSSDSGGVVVDALSDRIADAVRAQKSFDTATNIRRAVDSDAAQLSADSAKRLAADASALRTSIKRLTSERDESGEKLRGAAAELADTKRSLQRAVTRVDELSAALAACDSAAATAARRLRDIGDERDNASEMYRRAAVTSATAAVDVAALRSALTDMTARATFAESELIRERSTARRSDLTFAVTKRRSDVAVIALVSAAAAYFILAANTQTHSVSYHM